jgi:cytochrome c peroxidase
MEHYLLNYFKAATYVRPERASEVNSGRALFTQIGCNSCHIPNLTINVDRRVADLETNFSAFNPADGTATDGNPFNELFGVPTAKIVDQGGTAPTIKLPARGSFVVQNFFADLKRHDLGSNFWERNFDGTILRQIMTEPLWGVGTTAPYGHDGRTHNLDAVILRHGGEATAARNAFAGLSLANRNFLISFLNSLVLFAPDDTASALAPINTAAANFPQNGHGAFALTVLFNNPADRE